MPELPEVETTLRGIAPHVRGATISGVEVRNVSLRWPVPEKALNDLVGLRVDHLHRRAKYLLLQTCEATILLHLGMSGSLRVLPQGTIAGKHDHVDIIFDNHKLVRLNDPRRFGCCLVITEPLEQHKLLANLGPEPLSNEFDGELLFQRSRGRSLPVKNFIMDSKIVVGVGNIYAGEALFLAGIRPGIAASRISRDRYTKLAACIKTVLTKAIKAGGTTLNDFTSANGSPGYFKQELNVYGRKDQPCLVCGDPIKVKIIGQRSSFYCSTCQA